MASASPSEFLTFMRYASLQRTLRPHTARSSISPVCRARSLHISSIRYGQGTGPDVKTDNNYGPGTQEHTTDRAKKDTLDVQSEGVAKAQGSKASGGADNATGQKDSNNSTEKTKQEHPEAPQTVIGMQDERGGKGR